MSSGHTWKVASKREVRVTRRVESDEVCVPEKSVELCVVGTRTRPENVDGEGVVEVVEGTPGSLRWRSVGEGVGNTYCRGTNKRIVVTYTE